jgi:hypothetical protein
MIYLRLAGGLGNQLYQLAAASLLSQVTCAPVIPLLEGLNRYDEPRAPDSLKLLQPSAWLRSPTERVPAHWSYISLKVRAGRWLPRIGVSDRNFWQTFVSGGGMSHILDGYFQHRWTHDTFAQATNAMQVLPIAASAADRLMFDEVAVHIRGGDFLRLPRFQVVHAPFYIEAVRQSIALGFTRFAVITDDPKYAAEVCNAIQCQCPSANLRVLAQGTSALEDFDTLRSAPGRIIGNSTFAWWATVFGIPTAPTWSPTKFATDDPRDFFLPNERQITCAST